jgi:hypothetical protein
MGLGRSHADAKSISDFFVTLTFGEESHDFPLTRGQTLARFGSIATPFRAACDARKQNLGHFAGEKWLMPRERFDRFDKKLRRFRLQDEALYPGLENLGNQFLGLVRGEDENLRLWQTASDLNGRIEAIQLGHAHIHHDNVGRECEGLLDGLTAGGSEAANLPAWLSLDHRAGALTHHVMIVSD